MHTPHVSGDRCLTSCCPARDWLAYSLLQHSDTAAACQQVEVVSPEAYAYDGECIAKAEELRKPGLVDIRPLPVITA